MDSTYTGLPQQWAAGVSVGQAADGHHHDILPLGAGGTFQGRSRRKSEGIIFCHIFAELQTSKQASRNISERSATISHVRLCVVRFDGYHPEIFAIFPMFNSALHALFLKIQTFFFHYKWPVHNANIHGHHILAKESKKRQLQAPHEKNSDNGGCVSSGEAIP